MKLHISMDLWGPELADSAAVSVVRTVVRQLHVFDHDTKTSNECSLTLVFCVSGSLGRCPFEGIQVDGLSRRKRSIVIKAAVPDCLSNPAELEQYMFASLQEAIDLAKDKFSDAKIPFLRDEELEFVDQFRASLRQL